MLDLIKYIIFTYFFLSKVLESLKIQSGTVVLVYNPSYLEGRNQDDHRSKPV
jgi:hypothetical protein